MKKNSDHTIHTLGLLTGYVLTCTTHLILLGDCYLSQAIIMIPRRIYKLRHQFCPISEFRVCTERVYCVPRLLGNSVFHFHVNMTSKESVLHGMWKINCVLPNILWNDVWLKLFPHFVHVLLFVVVKKRNSITVVPIDIKFSTWTEFIPS